MDRSTIELYVKDFVDFAVKTLEEKYNFYTKELPNIVVITEPEEDSGSVIQTTGSYNIHKNEITVYCFQRNIGDILRSVGHELVHYMQRKTGNLDDDVVDEIAGLDDVNQDERLYNLEYEANGLGGMLFRAYKEHIKRKLSRNEMDFGNGAVIKTNINFLKINENNIFDLYSQYIEKDKKHNQPSITALSINKQIYTPKQKTQEKSKIKNVVKKLDVLDIENKQTLQYLDELAEELKQTTKNYATITHSEKMREFHSIFNKFFTNLFEEYNFYLTPNKQIGTLYEYIFDSKQFYINITLFPLGIVSLYNNNNKNEQIEEELNKYPICTIILKKDKNETVFDFDAENLKSMYNKIKKILSKNILKIK